MRDPCHVGGRGPSRWLPKLLGWISVTAIGTQRGHTSPIQQTKTPVLRGFWKRMKGLEPSTFCMASRRSSQLSYSRNAVASLANRDAVS